MKRSDIALAAACLLLGSAKAGFAEEAPAAAPATSAQTATAPAASADQPAATSNAVVLYIDPQITDRKWSKASVLFRPIYLTDDGLNDVGKTVTARLTGLVTKLVPDATVVTTPQSGGGVKYYIVPTVKRLDQIAGAFAWNDNSYVMELEWRVTDRNGTVVLLDTVKGEAKGKFGTSFTAANNAKRIEGEMLDQAMASSETLLRPILTADASQPAAAAATAGTR